MFNWLPANKQNSQYIKNESFHENSAIQEEEEGVLFNDALNTFYLQL